MSKRLISALVCLLAVFPLAAPAVGQGSWSTVDSPNAVSTQHNFLNDVTCVSDSDCWAVGYYQSHAGYQGISQHWDGREWSLSLMPDTSATQNDFVQSVACASALECFAVGYRWSRPDNAYLALIKRFHGEEWVDVTPDDTNLATNTFLIDVACDPEGECWAVGHRQIGILGGGLGPNQTLVMRWDGSTWEVVTSPNSLVTENNSLTSVSCPTASDCMAVGYRGAPGASQTLALRWDGSSWEIVASANTSATQPNLLNGVNCLAPDDCWAVGITDSGVEQTLTMHWDGRAWGLVESPNSGPDNANVLFNVACLSAIDCWAAGYHKPHPWLQNLILHWDGSEWTTVTSPNSAPGQTNTLRGISCVPHYGCWAAGNYYGTGSISHTLMLNHQAPQTSITATRLGLTFERVRGGVVAVALLTSEDGQPFGGREVQFNLNGVEWTRVATDAEGTAESSLHRSEIKRGDVVDVRFVGGEGLGSSEASSRFEG